MMKKTRISSNYVCGQLISNNHLIKPVNEATTNSTGLSKLRYLAEDCIFKIMKRLRTSVLIKLTKNGKNKKMERQLACIKQKSQN